MRPEVADAIERAMGTAPTAWTRVRVGGYTPAERWLASLEDGRRVFAKVGATELVAGWLRDEHRAYLDIRGPFMPSLLGWADGPPPVLVLEDLSAARWPPPWDARSVDLTLAALDAIAATPPPGWTRPIESDEVFDGWSRIAAEREPFVALDLVSEAWLESALPVLVAHERPADLVGDALVHFDVRSDNICFSAGRAIFVDWNLVARGNPLFDVAAWLPSLVAEGGPAPESVAPAAGIFAAALAGYFCSRAPLPPIADAPRVRTVQLQQAKTSLAWAARWLGLPPPDGRRLVAGV
jgi:hypothetical protein